MSWDPCERGLEFYVADAERVFAEDEKALFFSHWTYKMLTRSFLVSYQNPPLLSPDATQNNFVKGDGYVDYCTWHRYSDFEWFAGRMVAEFPGIIFPPIPEKEVNGTIDKLTAHFDGISGLDASKNPLVRQRLRRLQLCLNALSRISVLHECDLMKAFTTLEEQEWRKFRETWDSAKRISLLSSVKRSCLGLFGKLRSLVKLQVPAEGAISSNLGYILRQHGEVVRLLKACSAAVENITRRSVGELRKSKSAQRICKETAGAALPAPVCHEGCVVQHSQDKWRKGVVKSSDWETAVVEWSDREGVTARVPVRELRYPSSGVSDPTILALHAVAEQIDSHLSYISKNESADVLREVGDLLWFATRLSMSCMKAVTRLKKLEMSTSGLEESATGKGGAEPSRMKQMLLCGYKRFVEQYDGFCRPYQAQVLTSIAQKFGEVATVLFVDEGWGARVAQITSALEDTAPLPSLSSSLPQEQQLKESNTNH